MKLIFGTFLCLAAVYASPLRVVTVVSQDDARVAKLRNSADYWGLDLDVLVAKNQPWQKGYITKVYEMQKYLKTQPPQQLLLFVDGHDVFIAGNSSEIIGKFHLLNGKIIFNAQRNVYPNTLSPLISKYPKTKGSPYLNSGAYIGEAGRLSQLFDGLPFDAPEVMCEGRLHDQALFSLVYLDEVRRNSLGLKLDHMNVLMATLSRPHEGGKIKYDRFKLTGDGKDRRFHEAITGTSPVIFHGNGPVPAKRYLNHLYKMYYP